MKGEIGMKVKTKLVALMLMAAYCIAPGNTVTANAASTSKIVAVHANIWTVHGIYTKSFSSKTAKVTNYSGYGEYGYCYGQVRANIGGWGTYSQNYKLYKSNSEITMYLTNTIDVGKQVSLRLIGADSQTKDDNNLIKFNY
ncbi:MAG: hypothetical protein NC225_01130 [Clostridium sp.]|nr:hypothetical protein [Clostridium sp.]MCM1459301.1 hypothetical protein [Bacteroides sp.]